jgi:phage shock protein E
MLRFIKKLFLPSHDFHSLIEKGAPIIDVRSKGEYHEHHISGAINIPLNRIAGKAKQLAARRVPVVTCCRSGLRSLMARRILQKAGVKVYNGGVCGQLHKQL